MRLAIILAVLLVASAAFAKWMQLPMLGGDPLMSQCDYAYPFCSECADDFFCEDGDPITAVEWWGTYWNGTPLPPDCFVIRFYADQAAPPWSQPLDPPLYEYECYDYNEEYDHQYDWYRCFCELPCLFFQEAGNIYWLSVQAVLPLPQQWGWAECAEEYYWMDEAVMDFELLGVARWTPISQIPDIAEYRELSFVLHSAASPVEAATWSRIKALYR